MVLSKRVARSSIHLGLVQLMFGCAGVACGAVAKSKLTGPVGATIGLWAAYFVALGIICVVAGFFKNSCILGIALVLHIIGIIIAAIGVVIAALFWAFLNTCSGTLVVPGPVLVSDLCACGVVGDLTNYDVSCSDLRDVRNITAAATIIYLILEITSLIGMIFGCAGICCCPQKEPRAVKVTKVNSPSTSEPEAKPMIMTTIFSKKDEKPESKGKNAKLNVEQSKTKGKNTKTKDEKSKTKRKDEKKKVEQPKTKEKDAKTKSKGKH